jgi:hypothetical protein
MGGNNNPGPDPKSLFKRFDTDGDGKLSEEEFVAGLNKFRAERDNGRPPQREANDGPPPKPEKDGEPKPPKAD